MEYTKLGNSGLEVSRICCGGMSFGKVIPGSVHTWLKNEEETKEIIKKAINLGINFFDTANAYAEGTSEEYIGKALKEYANRDEIVIATKYFMPMGTGPNMRGCSRKHILSQVDQSLKRLGTDYIDLYVMHRWDYNTPIEETMATLNDLVRQGKVRYLGASAMYTWQFQKARNIADRYGWANFISMQNHLNLIYREDERELLPYCKDAGVSCTPYSPLASGRLIRPLDEQLSERSKTDKAQQRKYGAMADADTPIINRVAEIAEKRGLAKIQVALAWILHKEEVAAPVVGATKTQHLEDAVMAVGVELSPEEIAYLEEPYVPHRVVGAF